MKRILAMYRTEIHIKGKMNPLWTDWFEEMHMHESGCDETILYGNLPDMAAVYGIISHLSSLVIPLISVTCREETKG
jgi:hypothetical protein